ncbi:periplasmic heavy metal sensor [Marivita sp.]|uniref:periplasmic heavy metal sensor n=1 Tax=Marivita sp. TaxID=2003365 RepID=UPI0025BD2228|nr:periplasmic heavy metal sensor [Marivita sp.]
MAAAPKPKAPLWMRVTLLVSLAVNVLILAAVTGFFLSGGPDRRADRDRGDFGSFYTRALSDQDRRALRRDFVSGLERQGRDRGAFLADLQATLDTLRATPFDPEAFVSAMAEQSDRRARREDLGRQVLANRIAAMTDEERRAYADRIEARLSNLAQRVRR